MRPSVPYAPPIAAIERTIDFVARSRGRGLAPDRDVLEPLLTEFGRFAAEVIAPTDAIGDERGATLEDDGSVLVPPEMAKAHRTFVASGWAGVAHPAEIGGGGLGRVVGIALQEMAASANLALSLNTVLTQSAVELLTRWGTDGQRDRYLAPLVAGTWSGTMNLTEPDAGSDLGAIRARAVPSPDGGWRISGTKIFITWGEHDLADNIVHLVLARTPDSPPGTKGISVFVVPKLLPDGRRNTVRCVSLEHKLGIHASPTCVLSFEDAEGELVGPEHGGMRAMFSMMNPARLAIAVQGLAIGERSWQQAHAYAQVRRQGRDPRTRSGPVALVEHPDVRRMLADLRSTTRALRLLLYTTAAEAEAAEAAQVDGDGGGNAVSPARRRVDVLTPIVKAWCTDEGVRLASLALQVHGGAGYVEETGIAQRLRDSRIAPIYEGTNGIQAVDLVQRKVLPDGGAALLALLDDLPAGAPVGQGELAAASDAVRAGLAEVRTTTEWLAGTNAAADGPDDVLAGATPYLELVATVAAGALLASYAATAVTSGWPEAHELVEDARFFATHRLRPALGLGPVVRAGSEPLPRFP